MTTAEQDRKFKTFVSDQITAEVPMSILEDAVAWIAKNLKPDDVFKEDQLSLWAETHGYEVPE